jgi:hypothetical protein
MSGRKAAGVEVLLGALTEHFDNNSWFLLKAILDTSGRICGATRTRREKELTQALWIRARRWVGAPAESSTIRDKVALPLTTKT